jgi:hypothetical protein
MLKFLAGLTACFVVLCAGYALASRNSSGTYAPTSGIPVVSGTTISSATFNNLISDMGSEITDSLSRSGKGGMTAAMKGSDGTVAAPAFSFTSDPDVGLYRIGANDLGLSMGGSKTHEWITTGETVTGTLAVSGNVGVGAAPTERLSVFPSSDVDATLMAGFRQSGGGLVFGVYDESGGSTTAGAGSAVLKVGNTSGGGSIITTGAVTIGASGTAISASYRGTTTWNPASTTNGQATTTITVTGAAAGADCVVTPPSTITTPFAIVPFCVVTLNTCTVGFWSIGTNDLPSDTWACRVFNP